MLLSFVGVASRRALSPSTRKRSTAACAAAKATCATPEPALSRRTPNARSCATGASDGIAITFSGSSSAPAILRIASGSASQRHEQAVRTGARVALGARQAPPAPLRSRARARCRITSVRAFTNRSQRRAPGGALHGLDLRRQQLGRLLAVLEVDADRAELDQLAHERRRPASGRARSRDSMSTESGTVSTRRISETVVEQRLGRHLLAVGIAVRPGDAPRCWSRSRARRSSRSARRCPRPRRSAAPAARRARAARGNPRRGSEFGVVMSTPPSAPSFSRVRLERTRGPRT